jgi:hypothetical protein
MSFPSHCYRDRDRHAETARRHHRLGFLFGDFRYDSAYPVIVKYRSDSAWTSSDFCLHIAAANAILLPGSIPSRKRSGNPTNSAHDWARFAQQFPRRRRRNRAEIGVGTILMGNVVTMLDIRQMFSKFPRILPSSVNQSVHVSASVRSDGSTSEQVDHSAAFIYAPANDVVDKALNYVISKNQDFQDSMKTPQGKQGCFHIACP